MAEYHVKCGADGIYAGTMKKNGEWKNSSNVTDEAIAAVRDWMLMNKPAENDQFGYGWEKVAGGAIVLVVSETFDEENAQEAAGV